MRPTAQTYCDLHAPHWHKAISLHQSTQKELYMNRHIFLNLAGYSFSDWSSQTSRSDGLLDHKLFVHKYICILCRLDLYFLWAHFLLNAHWAVHQLQKSVNMTTWNLGHIFQAQLNHFFTIILCSMGLHSKIFLINSFRWCSWRRSSNLKFRTNLWFRVTTSYGCFVSNDTGENSKIEALNRKLKLVPSMQVSTCLLNISHLWLFWQEKKALIAIDSEWCQEIVFKLLRAAIWNLKGFAVLL